MVARGAADKSVYPVNLPSPDRYVYMSGELVPETEATLSIYDTAVTTTTAPPPARPDSSTAWWAQVTLGDTITDSSRTFAHKPFKLEQHIRRLYDSAKAARIDIGFPPERMLEITLELLERNLPILEPDQDCWIVCGQLHQPSPCASLTRVSFRAATTSRAAAGPTRRRPLTPGAS